MGDPETNTPTSAETACGDRSIPLRLELEAVFDALVDPVVIIDAHGCVLSANPAAVAAIGFDPTGHDRLDLVERLEYRRPDGSTVAAADLPGVRAQGGERIRDWRVSAIGAEGRRSLLMSASPFPPEGTPLGTVVTFHDITEEETLLGELRESVRLSEALDEINAAISSSLEFDAIMTGVVRISAEALGAQHAAVALPERDGWVGRFLYGARPGVRWVPIPEAERHYIENVAGSPEPLLVADASADPRLAEVAARARIGAVASVRLDVRGRLVGVLRFSFEEPTRFGRAHRGFLEKLAASVSLGLQNAQLIAAERDVSEKLQSALLAIPAHVRGVRCGTLYHSASDTARVGGDFYDLFELPHHHAALVIGDVSGKGLEAAAMTSLAKNSLRAYASEGHGAASVVTATNRVLVGASEPETFVTIFFGLLDTASGRLSYCSGGHPGPLVKRANGGTEGLRTNSPFVGAFGNSVFAEDVVTLGPGDVMLMYTDGVTESRCEDGMLGDDRLEAFLASLPPTAPEELPQAVFDFVLECTKGSLSDDLAMLAVSLGR